jgi:hypothetical protein
MNAHEWEWQWTKTGEELRCGGKRGKTNLHAEIGVRHSAVNSQFSKWSTTVLCHRVENGFGLETGCFKGGARNVAFLGVGCDADWIGSV